jgi:hypothetical protein
MRSSKSALQALTGRLIWVAFAVVFFYSGLFTTEWLLEPEQFAGGWRWILVGLFPVLVPAFFVVNRRYGCASGACRTGTRALGGGSAPVKRMPGA